MSKITDSGMRYCLPILIATILFSEIQRLMVLSDTRKISAASPMVITLNSSFFYLSKVDITTLKAQ